MTGGRHRSAGHLDWGTLLHVLTQADLRIDWHFGQTAVGDETLEDAPEEAGFYWRKGEQQIWGVEFSKPELADCIRRLQARDVPVPPEFLEALLRFPESR